MFGPCLSSNVGDFFLRTPTARWLRGSFPPRLPNQPHPHPIPINLCFTSDAIYEEHRVLIRLSPGYPQLGGRLDTRYAPVRRSPSSVASHRHAAPRLACVKPVASVHPEPGSNSTLYILYLHRTGNRLNAGTCETFHLYSWTPILQYQVRNQSTSFEKKQNRRFVHYPDGYGTKASPSASCTTTSLSYVILSKISLIALPHNCRKASRRESGCKGTAKINTRQIFRELFCYDYENLLDY